MKPARGYAIEQDNQRQVLLYLKLKKLQVEAQGGGFFYGKMYTGPMLVGNGRKVPNPMAGFPDVPVLYLRKGETRGQLIGIEMKQPGKQRSKKQIETHEALIAAGAICFVAETMDDVAAFFGDYDAKQRELIR